MMVMSMTAIMTSMTVEPIWQLRQGSICSVGQAFRCKVRPLSRRRCCAHAPANLRSRIRVGRHLAILANCLYKKRIPEGSFLPSLESVHLLRHRVGYGEERVVHPAYIACHSKKGNTVKHPGDRRDLLNASGNRLATDLIDR